MDATDGVADGAIPLNSSLGGGELPAVAKSDGLHGEPFGDEGWFARFSKHRPYPDSALFDHRRPTSLERRRRATAS